MKSIFPSPETVDVELPIRVQTYLTQALDSISSPDGAAMLAGAAVDAMLKEKGFKEGSVYSRIQEAMDEGILTKEMAEWAHDVRLGSNRPRHSDDTEPHVSAHDGKQAVEFAKMLGHFLFVLPARVKQKATLTKESQQ